MRIEVRHGSAELALALQAQRRHVAARSSGCTALAFHSDGNGKCLCGGSHGRSSVGPAPASLPASINVSHGAPVLALQQQAAPAPR